MNQPLLTLKLCLEVNNQSKNAKYANGGVEALVRGGCLPVKEWKYTDNLCECAQKKQRCMIC